MHSHETYGMLLNEVTLRLKERPTTSPIQALRQKLSTSTGMRLAGRFLPDTLSMFRSCAKLQAIRNLRRGEIGKDIHKGRPFS